MDDYRVKTSYGKVTVIDLELTCWESVDEQPEGQECEIIEIGVALITIDTLQISRPRSIYVRPEISTISAYCTKLTGITQEVLEQKGVSRAKATSILYNEYKLGTRVWAGWGHDNDIIKDKFLDKLPCPTYINIAALYNILQKSPRSLSLDHAIDYYGIKSLGRRHSGATDAHDAAQVLVKILSSSS